MIPRTRNRVGGGAAAIAYALTGLIAVATPQPALASDWGCQVVLCLATPGSPTTYKECIEPITELWRVLATPGGSFPTCDAVGISTKKVDGGYRLFISRPDGITSNYFLNTDTRSVTQQ